ncbi:microsomal signal peptidase 12 kDa subunit [Hesseltinella vesiculosa]|uniref:Signal peptidase complex subunit 1 n=1 Tax=Hesseltinella vesiculosa TaxID=101127 RepID=A0A1X2GFS4_9FUNG|nr:microsomal signal peptidase 12 kDa subunit [Hesseltinella vesiculosa]
MAIIDYLQWTIDYKGQRLNEYLTHILLVITSVAAFAAGYMTESMRMILAVFAFGFIVTSVVVLPPWPMYRRHQLKWKQIKAQ